MIVSHLHRFIFIKTRRTAGSSVEAALSPFLGPLDIVTGSLRDGTARQNCPDNITGHIGWKKIQCLVGDEVFRSYRVFCIERNPVDKVLSGYFWYRQALDFRGSLFDYIKQERSISDWDRYTSDGVPVGEVYNFNDLIKNPKKILGFPVSFPHLKKTHKQLTLLSDWTIEVIRDKFKNEYELLEALKNDKERPPNWKNVR